MAANEEKISIANLKQGMYVSRLEIPWIDTPFALEGMPITSQEDIDFTGSCHFQHGQERSNDKWFGSPCRKLNE